ncbi:serine protease [Rubinisphaera margarita]|uniref:serine protease n=1 Tax=Rubinisphaera margarita TaxID=2909586 RepID=UPI001EE8E53E|nr:serine protease [Rubinisphaera margarita]MCG6156566.1 serine protease [Rubinisphaera margarita]
MHFRTFPTLSLFALLIWCPALVQTASAQSVGLPAPRLLTLSPMGAQAGTTVEVTVSGDFLEGLEALHFSSDAITATPKLDSAGTPIPNLFTVTVAEDCPAGNYDARVTSRLGLSSARTFQIADLQEVLQAGKNISVESAQKVPLNSICNGSLTARGVDHYSFDAQQGDRIVVDCAAKGIDSKLTPVVIIADAAGQDLIVERRGGLLDFKVPETGGYLVKIHDLTFDGGPHFFYRLALRNAEPAESITRLPSTRDVNAFSWPPADFSEASVIPEVESQDGSQQIMPVSIPCTISGSFYPAADVDVFEFTAKKGEVWWLEIASSRLGLSTDPSIVVQRVEGTGEEEKLTDVLQLTDLPSPIKVSSNGYAFDGPCYNTGSADAFGKLEIPADGTYRVQVTDLFGGTRNDPQNEYRLSIRQAAPDFAVVAWATHMELRNGDRNALSKPIALRRGASMPLDVIVFRRDGFDGEIELTFDNLPEGVTASGLKIPADKSNSTVIFTAAEDAPRGFTRATFTATSTLNGKKITRRAELASMAWPVPDHWREAPAPRLLADVPVSVSDAEAAPISIAAAEERVYEAKAGEKLTIPLKHVRRCEFSGKNLGFKTFGAGFERTPVIDISLDSDSSEAVIDLAALKTKPGDYQIAFYGGAVAKYSYCPEMVAGIEAELEEAKRKTAELQAQEQAATEKLKAAAEDAKPELEKSLAQLKTSRTAGEAEIKAIEKRLQDATRKAAPKDIVDIVVTPPIKIRVTPAEEVVSK